MGKQSRTDYSILNIATGLGGYALNTLLGLICRMVFTRTLAADYLGVNGLFTNILSMLSLAELGIGSAIVFALYKPLAHNDKDKIASLVKFYGRCYRIIGVLVGVVGICLMPFLNVLITQKPDISESLYLIYGLYLFNTASTYFFSYRGSLLTAAQQNYLVTGLSYLVTIIQSVVQMALLLLTHNYLSYLLAQTLGVLVYNITISCIAKRKYPYIVGNHIKPLEQEEKKGLIKNVRALVIIKLSGMLVNQTDNIIITYFQGLKTVGYASNYTLLTSTLNTLIAQLFSGITASVGNHNALETDDKKVELFSAINLANFWLFGWAAVGIFVVSTDIVKLMFGEGYGLNLSIPFALAVNFYMVGMQNAVWTYKNTLGLFRHGRYLLLVTAAINLACSIWLGNLWGLFGIYIATAISRACTNAWYDPYAVFKYGFHKSAASYFLRYIEFALILVVVGGISWKLSTFFTMPLLWKVVIEMIVCSVIFNCVFVICFHRQKEFCYLKELIGRVLKKVVTLIKR